MEELRIKKAMIIGFIVVMFLCIFAMVVYKIGYAKCMEELGLNVVHVQPIVD